MVTLSNVDWMSCSTGLGEGVGEGCRGGLGGLSKEGPLREISSFFFFLFKDSKGMAVIFPSVVE